MDAVLRGKLEALAQECETSARDLRGDGVYPCCTGTYDHCASRIRDILSEHGGGGEAVAWQAGYEQGILDERESEANIGIAGFNAKIDPARVNPYTTPPSTPSAPVVALPPSAVAWHPIDTAPKDNKCPLYLAQFDPDTGDLIELDWDATWEAESESWELPQVYYIWRSANGRVEEPTHWAYQNTPSAPVGVEAMISLRREAQEKLDRSLVEKPNDQQTALVLRTRLNAIQDCLSTALTPTAAAPSVSPAGEGGLQKAIGMLCETMALLRYDGGLRDGDFANRIEQAVNLLKATAEQPGSAVQEERKVAPWPDYAGNPIHEGDTIRHPTDGATGVVFVLANETDDHDRWRVLYNGDATPARASRLCLQIDYKGQAVVAPPAPAAEQGEQWLDIPPFLRRNATSEEIAEWNAKYAQPEARGVEDMMIPAVSPNGSDEDMLKYLDELLAAQGTLMFARRNYNEDQAECFGVAILDFMRLYGMRLRAKLTATPNPVRAEQLEGKWKLVPVEPTPEQVRAGTLTGILTPNQASAAYQAMLLAAPTQEQRHAD